MDNNKNLLLTIALSVLILILWQVFYINPQIEEQRQAAEIERQRQVELSQQNEQQGDNNSTFATDDSAVGLPQVNGAGNTAAGQAGDVSLVQSREAAIADGDRITINTVGISGSINLQGARFDDLTLRRYTKEVDPESDKITVLNPASQLNGYFVELGYAGAQAMGALPNATTSWIVDGNRELTTETPVTLTFSNENGLTFRREISIDDNYLFTLTDTIQNSGAAEALINPYGRVTRFQKPQTASIYVLHEGLIGVTGEEGLQEVDYSDLEDDKEVKPGKSSDGWIGITDKYWAAAIVPSQVTAFQPKFSYFDTGRSRFQSDYLNDAITIAAGAETTLTQRVFAGAKVTNLIDTYKDEQNIRQFDLLIDWGWFYFITKPLFYVMHWLFGVFGNFGVAILLTTVLVKAIFYPLANKSYTSMARMKVVQPKMTEIREKYADDRTKQQQMMMELYKKEKINPLAGCWPVLIQIPVFFALYKVLYVTIEMRHAPFFGWIQDLAAPDPTSVFNLFGLLPYDIPFAFLMVGVWPLIMGITMFLQMRMNPLPPDPTQAMIFTWMPVIFTFMLASFPAGLVIYWAWNNTLSIIQQGIIMKRQGAKIELWDNLMAMFKPKSKTEE